MVWVVDTASNTRYASGGVHGPHGVPTLFIYDLCQRGVFYVLLTTYGTTTPLSNYLILNTLGIPYVIDLNIDPKRQSLK